jgi:hypothetical protein
MGASGIQIRFVATRIADNKLSKTNRHWSSNIHRQLDKLLANHDTGWTERGTGAVRIKIQASQALFKTS